MKGQRQPIKKHCSFKPRQSSELFVQAGFLLIARIWLRTKKGRFIPAFFIGLMMDGEGTGYNFGRVVSDICQ
jgi:hypothetical protein